MSAVYLLAGQALGLAAAALVGVLRRRGEPYSRPAAPEGAVVVCGLCGAVSTPRRPR